MLVNGLEEQLNEGKTEPPIDPNRPADRDQLEELLGLLDDMLRHHAFEERVLFPIVRKRGDADMVALFTDEHAAMGPFAKRLRRITEEVMEFGISGEGLEAFRRALTDFSEYVMLHIQKKELALIQKLDTLIDSDTDQALATKYASQNESSSMREAG